MLKRIVGLALVAVAGLIVWLWLRRHQDDFATMSTQFTPPELAVRPPPVLPTSKPASPQTASTPAESRPGPEEHVTPAQVAEAPAPPPAPMPAEPQPDTSTATSVAAIEAGDDGAAEKPELSTPTAEDNATESEPDASEAEPEQPVLTAEDTATENEPEAEPKPEQPALTAKDTAAESEPDASESDLDEVTGYCVRCKTKRTISDAHEETTESGRRAARGTCPICGANMFTFLKDEPQDA
jgi:hypothetical protein